MAFKNLENRFNENVNKLYGGATNKFDDGRASNGRSDHPLIVREPGAGYLNGPLLRQLNKRISGKLDISEGRSTPIRSTQVDVKRLTLFQLSPTGIKFLAKQQLLQTGNTFKFTRIINPAFVIANAVPFLHVKRNLRPLSELKGKTDTSYENVRKMGTMQSDSYDKLKKWKIPVYMSEVLNQQTQSKSNFWKKLGGLVKNSIGNKLAQAFSPITSTLSAASPLLKRNIGEEKSWNESRPELAKDSIIDQIKKANSAYQKIHTNTDEKFIKYFSAGRINPSENVYNGGVSGLSVGEEEGGVVNINRKNSLEIERNQFKQKISYVSDASNIPKYDARDNALEPYKYLNSSFDDPIVVSFAMGKDKHIRFRAFIKDLQQTAQPEYNSYQYIGRVEKFINYLGVQREVSFKLGIIAFSETELDMVWARINYITSFVYPYGFNKGIMQPNIVRMTLGDIYKDQPGYISVLNTNFGGLTDSWEISPNKQVPISAEMEMRFTLIEKYTKIASSPFYGITETMVDQKTKRNIFVQPIEVPTELQAPPNPALNAPKSNTPTGIKPANINVNAAMNTLRSSVTNRQLPNTVANAAANLLRGFGGGG